MAWSRHSRLHETVKEQIPALGFFLFYPHHATMIVYVDYLEGKLTHMIFTAGKSVPERTLRRPCNLLIAALSLSDAMLMCSSLISTAYHSIHTLITSYPKFYLMVQLLPGCLLGITLDITVLVYRMQDEKVVCLVMVPLQGKILEVYIKIALIVCIMITTSNVCFLFFLKKIRMCSEKVRSIHRSVIIISLSFVFGYFASVIIHFVNVILHLNINQVFLNQSAGIFVSFATSANFFIYYGISREYRGIFDKLLGIGRLKMFLFYDEERTFTQQSTLRESRVLNRIVTDGYA
ncbi:unnamed protein product [Haemonchus placei]|uniref:G_PROTEIN_RECEP_F1_2 domain-containing protein n=1 Tax=Haemonchus placei TaxID=6290 RepID=A0A0N4WYL6_HAEPC|nr:unnamed protein product [Haemonchus placei]